jgi:prepilin-type N-terminal cleavage/methylation domain-containing protein
MRMPGSQRKVRPAAGFTLIEVMMAMTILSLGLFAVVQLQVVAIRGNAYARERTEAKDLLDTVVDDIRTRAMQWVDERTVDPDPDFNQAAYGGGLLMSATPAPGVMVPAADLDSLPILKGISIRNAPGYNGARPINVHGQPAGPGVERAIYRVHYYAFPLMAPDNITDLGVVRMTVFVSWDNRDHGSQTHAFDTLDPGTWTADSSEFFDRHVVSASFYVSRNRLW